MGLRQVADRLDLEEQNYAIPFSTTDESCTTDGLYRQEDSIPRRLHKS